jgi:hypothetical protein
MYWQPDATAPSSTISSSGSRKNGRHKMHILQMGNRRQIAQEA